MRDTPKFRRGMTLLRRQQLRAALLEAELERARRRALCLNVTVTCRNALQLTGSEDASYVQDLHAQCRGEEPGGAGCLCPCHDVIAGGVVTGSAEISV